MEIKNANTPEELALLETLLSPVDELERRRAWDAFVRRYQRIIVACICKAFRRYGVSPHTQDVDDLAGDVWLALMRDDARKLRQFRPDRGCRLASFIGLVATHRAIDHLRARRPFVDLDEAAELAAEHVEPSRGLEDRQRVEAARAAIGQLTQDERAFVFEVFQEERPPHEMARSLGLTVNTIYSRKFKIRKKLETLVA
jgi:RNA polymerase sigma-70 factor (ECF subfamily)